VFIDETWTKTTMEPLRRWAPQGERLVAKVPHRHWKTMTFVAALRHDRIDAPWLIDGPINGEGFRTYVEKVLVPTLKPGDLVIMDNLGSHKGKAVRRAIRSAGAKLFFLTKSSPDLNPIEPVFAKLKHLLRKAAARTSTPSSPPSASCSTPPPRLNAPTPSPTPATGKPKFIPLLGPASDDIRLLVGSRVLLAVTAPPALLSFGDLVWAMTLLSGCPQSISARQTAAT
jgi:putative transposase